MHLQDAILPVLTIVVLSPVATLGFKNGIPIEIIVFGLLVAGYKGPQWLKGWRRVWGVGLHAESNADPSGSESCEQTPSGEDNGSAKNGRVEVSGLSAWRSKIPWRSKASDGGKRGRDTTDEASWRSKPAGDTKSRKPADLKSGGALGALKKNNSPQLQWRSLINKFTPEKFDKLCEQLVATLPCDTDEHVVSDDEFKHILEELLALIFDASSRQHQYTEMYTDLCQKILEFVAQQKPDLDGKSCIWDKCQHIFLTVVLKTPEIPAQLPEDEYTDRKAKMKEKMVGMVKFGGDLVSRGLVPCEGVMQWIHTLLSEKTQEVYSADPSEFPQDGECDKDMEQREVQLEVLCAILASMGSSLSDSNTWSDENRLVIEDVFMQLQQLSMDTANLSLRIRCLIRDILDLRMAQWKEKEGKLKPSTLQPRKRESDEEQAEGNSVSREDVPEGKPWLDPQLIASLQAVEHHLEVVEDKDSKLHRLKALIQLYNLIQEKQIVIVANSSNVRRVVELIAESFKDVDFKSLDFNTPEQVRKKSINAFMLGETSILVMASEISTRRDFDFGKAATVLVNFDFPMTLQLYLYRLFKRADSNTHVYTFFSPTFDIRHTVPLIVAMDGAKQKIPAALQKLREQIKSDNGAKRETKDPPRRTPKGDQNREDRSTPAERDNCRDDVEGGKDRGGFRMSRTRSSNMGGFSSAVSTTWRSSEAARGHEEEREREEAVSQTTASRQAEERRREPFRKSEASSSMTRHVEVAVGQSSLDAVQEGRDWQLRARGAVNRRGPAVGGSRHSDGPIASPKQQGEEPAYRTDRAAWFDHGADSQAERRRADNLRSQGSPGDFPAGARGDRRTGGRGGRPLTGMGGRTGPP